MDINEEAASALYGCLCTCLGNVGLLYAMRVVAGSRQAYSVPARRRTGSVPPPVSMLNWLSEKLFLPRIMLLVVVGGSGDLEVDARLVGLFDDSAEPRPLQDLHRPKEVRSKPLRFPPRRRAEDHKSDSHILLPGYTSLPNPSGSSH